MNKKHLSTLELPKILKRMAKYTSFSAGEERARALEPLTDLSEISHNLETTSEARGILEDHPTISIGGAHDIRSLAADAERGMVLPPTDLLDVRDTLIAGRTLNRSLSRLKETYPRLALMAGRIPPCPNIIEEINRCLDERGNVRDEASPKLARIRREVQIAYDRIQEKLQNIVQSSQNASYLQEALVTRRQGRYVIPVKAQFKERIPGIVHDRSASGVTLFIEPLSVVDLNNTWRERQLEEEEEVRRILAHLSNLVAERIDEIEQTVEGLADLDLAFAKAKYAEVIDATAPHISNWPKGHVGSLKLLGARHPLLDPESVVPIDVVMDEETHILVITGPNTGGKTVSLKTVGLLTLMAQAGLHIPVAEGSTLSPFEAVYADIGDEQSIEQNLSTFSSHLTNIISFLDQADSRSLVLLDELGAGTDPAEGAALARALLDHFRKRKVTAFVATHYPELKNYAQLTEGVRNASVEFDPQTLSPTYRLTIGLPGRSNALAIAQRLNLPQAIIESAQEMVSPDDMRTEDMLDDIHRLRIQAAKERDAAHETRIGVEENSRELRKRLSSIEEERREILEQAREQAEKEVEALRSEVRKLRSRLRSAAPHSRSPDPESVEAVTDVEEKAKSLRVEISKPEPLVAPSESASQDRLAPESQEWRPIRVDDTVWVRPLNAKGHVMEIDGDEAEVQVGRIRTRTDLDSLELRAEEPEPEPEKGSIHVSPATSPGTRIDLRGCSVEETLKQLDRYLDQAARAGLPEVRIIHGKGTGALRNAVREFLGRHPLVGVYEAGGHKDGGDGVTIAELGL